WAGSGAAFLFVPTDSEESFFCLWRRHKTRRLGEMLGRTTSGSASCGRNGNGSVHVQNRPLYIRQYVGYSTVTGCCDKQKRPFGNESSDSFIAGCVWRREI